MRRILIEKARQRASQKHGGALRRTEFRESRAEGQPAAEEMLSLDAALDTLEKKDPTMAAVVKLRYFAGLTIEETADALSLSPRSVNRHWTAARAWLKRAMAEPAAP